MLASLAALPTGGGGPSLASATPIPSRAEQQAHPDYYRNLIAPKVEPGDEIERASDEDGIAAWWQEQTVKHSGGLPRAARTLAELEAEAAKTGKSPRELKAEAAGPGPTSSQTQVAQVLTVLVEFDPNAEDDFSGWEHPKDNNDPTCVTEPDGTLISGPLHNNLPNPATVGRQTDNNTFWVPDFSRDHYNKILFTETGITERVRKDLTGPDGNPGVNMRGYTMRNMYLEMSKNAYTVDGEVTPWLQLPRSEAYYGADNCEGGSSGDGIASDVGHPDNPRGVTQMVVDAMNELNATQPNFDWDRYDIEDQGDIDNDGNVFEPDGVIDHLNIVHAGADQADDGGEQKTYAVWSHASVVDPLSGGYTIPGTGKKVFNYIVQPEDAGVGVFAHEYGHDLGLPDLYDTSGGGDSDVEFWDLMSTGSHSGPLFQSIPTHMGAWEKYVLGWNDPVELNIGEAGGTFKLGQASRPPAGTEDSIKINLPKKRISLGEPHSGENMWWSSNDQQWADVRLERTIDVPNGNDVRFWMWNNYQIEADWDYGFVEVSTDGGDTWVQKNVYNEDGELVSTPNDYEDPNGRLRDYGDLEHGLTGHSDGWEHHYVNLSANAGDTIQLRLRYATDAAYEERAWFSDDFSLTDDGETVWTDDVEGGANGWTQEVESFAGTKGQGWQIFDGSAVYEQYYLAEWRSLAGFDRGLKYTYDTTYFNDGEWKVKKVPYNAPGMLLWYRNAQYSVNHVSVPLFDLPSVGSKGMLLLVDSHFDPLRRTGKAAEFDSTSTLKNIPSRSQAQNVAFGLRRTPKFQSCLEKTPGSFNVACNSFGGQRGRARFTDKQGWYPGMELREDGLWFRDYDASVVVPSRKNRLYTTRVVKPNGDPVERLYGKTKEGILLGTGDPKDGKMNPRRDRSLGVSLRLVKQADDNSWVLVKVFPGRL